MFGYDEVNPVLTKTLVDAVNSIQRVRPTTNRQIPARLNDYEIVPDNIMDKEEEIIHLAMLEGAKPLNYQDAM